MYREGVKTHHSVGLGATSPWHLDRLPRTASVRSKEQLSPLGFSFQGLSKLALEPGIMNSAKLPEGELFGLQAGFWTHAPLASPICSYATDSKPPQTLKPKTLNP